MCDVRVDRGLRRRRHNHARGDVDSVENMEDDEDDRRGRPTRQGGGGGGGGGGIAITSLPALA